jgi:hypothetical protein
MESKPARSAMRATFWALPRSLLGIWVMTRTLSASPEDNLNDPAMARTG